jgi:uncharacterized protein (TIGR03437 family)
VALSCDPKYVSAGASAFCELQLNTSSVSDSLTFSLSSSIPGVKLPARIGARVGQSRIRFEAAAEVAASPGVAVIEARIADFAAQENLAVLSPGVPRLSVPNYISSQHGLPVHFTAVALDKQNLHLGVTVSDQPSQAVFDSQTGEFEWLPTERDLGRHVVTFASRDDAGKVITQTTTIEILSGSPTLTGLQNGSGKGAASACTPGSVATVTGRFLSTLEAPVSGGGAQDIPTRLLINGVEAQTISIAKDRLDFVCPMMAPETDLEIVAEMQSGKSNPLRTRMSELSPGIFTVDRPGSGQAIAWRSDSSDLALIPSYRFEGKPVLAGDAVTILATGINCRENYGAQNLSISLGGMQIPIDSFSASTHLPGACEVNVTIPRGTYGDAVPMILHATRSDGRIVASNAASIAIGNEH